MFRTKGKQFGNKLGGKAVLQLEWKEGEKRFLQSKEKFEKSKFKRMDSKKKQRSGRL